jgi:hypothetical protein
MASDILDPVKPNYCPLFKNLLQIQIKIFKLISLSWGFDSFVDDAVVGEQSELAGFHIF